MALSEGQELALRQLRSLERAVPGAVEILAVDGDALLTVEISLDCAGLEHKPGGIRLRDRERFFLTIYRDFPYKHPDMGVPHRRWAGTAHVQWGWSLCIYAAPTVEWNPAGGMYSYVERLFKWLRAAAAGELDPAEAPLHPPVTYAAAGTPLVVPRADAPTVTDQPWFGTAKVDRRPNGRRDVTAWVPDDDETGELITPEGGDAAVVLLGEPMDWEWPDSAAGLVVALDDHGANLGRVLLHLGWVAAFRTPEEPLLVIIGSPMRRGRNGETLQHLTAWEIPADAGNKLALSLGRHSKDERRRELGEQARKEAIGWLLEAQADWCRVREARPEIIERRDSRSPMHAFADKSVAIWGCGALGGPLAEWIVRAGASGVILYDNSNVGPGLHVRQLFGDDDVGSSKARLLEQRLNAIGTGAEILARFDNVITGPLSREDWHDGADIVIDATASVAVQNKLERVRRLHPQDVTILTMLIGHSAERAVGVVAFPEHSGAAVDVLRSALVACSARPHLRGFLDEFWPDEPRQDLFQPEPGCSSPTFRGSGAEVAALASALLTSAAREISQHDDSNERSARRQPSAVVRLLSLPDVAHDGQRNSRLAWRPASTVRRSDDRYEVRVRPEAATELAGWIRSRARVVGRASETGGVIFGARDEAAGVIWVDEVSGPPPGSIESPEEFVCGTEGVRELAEAKAARTRGALEFLGIWHTHPDQSPNPSARDLVGMVQLLEEAGSTSAEGLILIIGEASTNPNIAAYTFARGTSDGEMIVNFHERVPLTVS